MTLGTWSMFQLFSRIALTQIVHFDFWWRNNVNSKAEMSGNLSKLVWNSTNRPFSCFSNSIPDFSWSVLTFQAFPPNTDLMETFELYFHVSTRFIPLRNNCVLGCPQYESFWLPPPPFPLATLNLMFPPPPLPPLIWCSALPPPPLPPSIWCPHLRSVALFSWSHVRFRERNGRHASQRRHLPHHWRQGNVSSHVLYFVA